MNEGSLITEKKGWDSYTRVNIYSEEMTDRVEIVEKVIDGETFTGVRFYLYLPVSMNIDGKRGDFNEYVRGPFIHRAVVEGKGEQLDDDSSAVTFWGKKDLRELLVKASLLLDVHYETRKNKKVEG